MNGSNQMEAGVDTRKTHTGENERDQFRNRKSDENQLSASSSEKKSNVAPQAIKLTETELEENLIQIATIVGAEKLDDEAFLNKTAIQNKAQMEQVQVELISTQSSNKDPSKHPNQTPTSPHILQEILSVASTTTPPELPAQQQLAQAEIRRMRMR